MLGKDILGYHVDEKIGSGGFGTVYKVSKTNAAGTYVRALKHITLPTKKQYASVLNSMGGDYAKADDYFASALKDIVGEIQILSTLSESGVVNIVRYYENDIIETPSPKTYDIYILMEYLTPFSDYLENKTFTVKDVIRLGEDMLKALVSCHEKNIIHRDIKDDNIFISADGIYKLGDFGVSKALKDKSRAESVKGTPNFIAPEVYLGKEKYDNTVDLYSLGIVLYKLLNHARNPFLPAFPAPYSTDDEDVAFEARMTGKIPELPALAQNELGQVILKAILPRAQRYDSASEFLSALQGVEAQMSEEALAEIVCDAIPQNEGTVKGENSVNDRDWSSDETIGVVYSVDEDETSRGADRHLFDTFAAPSYPTVDIPDAQPPKEAKENTYIVPPVVQPPIIEAPIPSNPPPQKAPPKPRKEGKVNVRRLLIFGMPAVLLLLYVGFYMLLIPALYGEVLSFFDWITADVNHIVTALQDANNILVPVYVIVLLVILQYVLLGALITSVFFLCKELHSPSIKVSASVKYTGQAPRMILNDVYLTLKSNAAFADRRALDDMRMVVESMKYSKDFGIAKQEEILGLENEICYMIDTLREVASSDTEEALQEVPKTIAVLKQKSILRDTMLKK